MQLTSFHAYFLGWQLISSGRDTEQLILTSLGFTLIFAIFAFFTSPERFAVN